MRGVLARIARAGYVPIHAMDVVQARDFYEAGAEMLDLPRAPLPRIEQVAIPVGSSHLAARLYAPSRAPGLAVLLYCHGGGYVVGSLETHDSLCRQLALHSGAAVLALDYRLAPEHPFPAAVEDAWAALCWLREEGAAALGLDARRIAVGGDSAGGTLAAVCALQARDAGWPLRLQMMFYPGTAGYQDLPSRRTYAQGYLLEQAHLDWFFGHYVADPVQRCDWRFAPLLAPDMDDVAPAWIGLAKCDPIADDGIAYADRLRMAAVAVDLEIWHGVTHDFVKMGRALPEGRRAIEAAGRALARAFEGA